MPIAAQASDECHVGLPLLGDIIKVKPSLVIVLFHACSDEDIAAVVRQALQEASMPATGLTYEDFDSVLHNSSLTMQVEVPNDA